jgi:hypothetical protein
MPDDHTIIGVLVTPTVVGVEAKSLDAEHRAALDRFVDNLRQSKPVEQYFDLSSGLDVDFANLVPDGLHVLPWAAMSYDGERVCERVAVGIVPSLSCIPALATKLAAAPTVQLFGPPAYPDRRSHRTGRRPRTSWRRYPRPSRLLHRGRGTRRRGQHPAARPPPNDPAAV